MLAKSDIEILRELGKKYMTYASLPVQEEKRKMWLSLNSLHMVKPMVCIDQLPWNELDVDGSLVCKVSDPFFRNIEWNLRTEIYKWEHLPVDMVLNPYILIPRPVQNTGYGITPRATESVLDKTNFVTGKHYETQIDDFDDIEKIKDPVVTIDRAAEAAVMRDAHEIFDGIAPVKPQGVITHLGLWDFISEWVGVEKCYFELLDRPEFMHAVMSRVTDATLAMIGQINALGLYDINTNMCHCSYTFTHDLPSASCDRENPTTHDGWGFGLAQLFTSVSPQITDEFEVAYMQKIFPHYGAIYYGCCDRLDDRLDIIEKMPNIRKISCSPWSNREKFAEKLNKKYIMSNKPLPAFLATDSLDEDAARADLRRTISAAKAYGVNLEIILKDVSTVKYKPEKLWRWAEIAAEESTGQI